MLRAVRRVWRDSLDGLLVTIPATCQELKVGRSTVYEMCARREIQSIKIGRSVRIVRASLVDLINRRMAEGLPTIGRIIHVVGDDLNRGDHLAAIVTRVDAEVIWVTAFIPGTVAIPASVGILNTGSEPGQWHWPERA